MYLNIPAWFGLMRNSITQATSYGSEDRSRHTSRLGRSRNATHLANLSEQTVASAELIDADSPDATPIALTKSAETSGLVEGGLVLTESKTWKLKLVDQDGRTNQQEVTLRAKAIPNESAKIKLVAGGDVLVSSPYKSSMSGAKNQR